MFFIIFFVLLEMLLDGLPLYPWVSPIASINQWDAYRYSVHSKIYRAQIYFNCHLTNRSLFYKSDSLYLYHNMLYILKFCCHEWYIMRGIRDQKYDLLNCTKSNNVVYFQRWSNTLTTWINIPFKASLLRLWAISMPAHNDMTQEIEHRASNWPNWWQLGTTGRRGVLE